VRPRGPVRRGSGDPVRRRLGLLRHGGRTLIR
jgi:hypothetical protein